MPVSSAIRDMVTEVRPCSATSVAVASRIASCSARVSIDAGRRGRASMIEAVGLTKHYGAAVAVDDLSFVVPAGQVTGFLGPNGAGKSTTMRMILGLDAPTAGRVTVNGRPYTA